MITTMMDKIIKILKVNMKKIPVFNYKGLVLFLFLKDEVNFA